MCGRGLARKPRLQGPSGEGRGLRWSKKRGERRFFAEDSRLKGSGSCAVGRGRALLSGGRG